jgi:hypothetical protein
VSLLHASYKFVVDLDGDNAPSTLEQKLCEGAPARPYLNYNVILPHTNCIRNCGERLAIIEKVLAEALENRGKAPFAGQLSASQNEERQIIGARRTASVFAEHVEHLAEDFVGMPRAILTHYVEDFLLAKAFSCRIHDVDDSVCEEHEKVFSFPPRLGVCARGFVRHPERRAVRFEPMRGAG